MKFLRLLAGVALIAAAVGITAAIADGFRYRRIDETAFIMASVGILALAWIFSCFSQYGEFWVNALNLVVWSALVLVAGFCGLFLLISLFLGQGVGIIGVLAAILALFALRVFAICVEEVKRLARDVLDVGRDHKPELKNLKLALGKLEARLDLVEMEAGLGKKRRPIEEEGEARHEEVPATEKETAATPEVSEKSGDAEPEAQELCEIKESVPDAATAATEAPQTLAAVATPFAVPVPETAAVMASPVKKIREKKGDAASLEAFIGTKLLSYSGIVILVLGIASLLVYSLTRMGPGGRTAVGFCLGAALFAAGRYLQRDRRYVMFGRVLMAGGWATLYFTAFGAHHIDAMKVIESPLAGTLLLAVVAASIIAHALRYASEAVTGVALFMAYLTLFVSEISLYTHIAAFLLAVLICVFVCKFRWITTHFAGMLFLYLGYGVWLYVQDAKYTREDSGPYLLATCLLVGLWVSFKVPEFTRAIHSWENRAFLVAGIMNVSCLALVRKLAHLAFEKGGEPYSALALCAIYLATGQVLRMRKRQPVYYLDSTIATVLVMFGLWFALGRLSSCMMAWLAWGTILFGYSMLRNERYFRDLGNGVAVLATLVVLGGELPHRFVHFCYNLFTGELFFGGGTPLPVRGVITPSASGIIALLGSSLVYVGAFLVWRLFKARPDRWTAGEISRDRVLNIVATLTALCALYKMLPGIGCAYGWTLLGAVLFQYGLYRSEIYLRFLSHLVLLWCACSGSLLGLSTAQIGVSLAVAAALIYLDGFLTYALIPRERLSRLEELVEKGLTVAGTLAMMVAATCLLGEFSATLFWSVLGAALFYYGMGRRDDFLRIVSHVAILAAAGRASLAALDGQDLVVLAGNWRASSAVINMLVAVALYYLHAWLAHMMHRAKSEKWHADEEAAVVSAANAILCLLLWFTLPPIAIAIAYAMCGLVFFRCGRGWRLPYLTVHSDIALILSGIWLFTVNLGATGYVGGIDRSLLSCMPPLALWLYTGFLWWRIAAGRGRWESLFPTFLSYMSFAAIVALIHRHFLGYGTGWAIYALVLLYMGHYLRHGRYALQTLIAMSMAGLKVCAVAGRAAGSPFDYFLDHVGLVVVPAAMFAAHAVSKISRFDADSPAGSDKTRKIHAQSRLIYALYFNLATAVVLTMVLPNSLYSLAWGAQALFAGWYGLTFREHVFRWLCLILCGLAIAKILCYDVFWFTAEERIVTFIAVGTALLAVSFLYNRLKDQLLRFLQEDR